MTSTIGIISLSSGIIGEDFVKHEVDLGVQRLKDLGLNPIFLPHSLKGLDFIKEHPEARAEDLIQAFSDDSIDMILCSIGGDDTYRLLPYLFENDQLQKVIKPKIFLGFSDTTMNHLMLHKLGIKTFYGQSFLADICELDKEMLPYSFHYFKDKAVQPGDWVDYGFGAGFPELLDRALAARRDELTDVKIRGGLVIRPRIEVVESDPEQKAFSYYSWHIGDYERKLQTRGLCKFMPMMLRSLPEMYRHHIRVDVAFVPVSRPDADGYCGLGISNYAWRTIFENARTVIFEINERLPRLQGVNGSHRVHLSEADFIVEGEHEPLPIRTYRDPSAVDIEIAKRVVEEIPDGAVLSLGVGGVPFTVANMLAQSDKTDLGCHTGTISDAFLALYKAGKLTNKKKEIDNGYSTWNLAMGSQELYDWLDNEPQLFHPADVDYVHSPYRIGEMKNVISINGGVELDLMGQENAESAGTRQLSGIGGQMDFLEGAFRSEGGKGFICLASTHKKKDGSLKSNIVPFIPGGSTVSAPRTMMQYVATEYGIAKLTGLTLKERADAMIAIAHPDFRDELRRYAEENFK